MDIWDLKWRRPWFKWEIPFVDCFLLDLEWIGLNQGVDGGQTLLEKNINRVVYIVLKMHIRS